MRKPTFNIENAEKLYVEDLWTLKQIAIELKVSEPTLRKYAELGEWKKKKAESIAIKESIFSDIKKITKKLGETIINILGSGKEPSAALLNAHSRYAAILAKVKEFEDKEFSELKGSNTEATITEKTRHALKHIGLIDED